MQIPFCGPTYTGRSTNIDSSRSINFYPEVSENPLGKSQISLIGTPGTVEFLSFSSGNLRFMYKFVDRLFVIVSASIYEVYTDGSVSATLASFPDSVGEVVATDNGMSSAGVGGDQILFLTGGYGYIFNVSTSVLTKITDPSFPANVSQCTYLDGYFIVTADSMKFNVSDLYDGLSWGGLAFAAVVATPDNIVAPVELHQQLYFFKNVSTEVWYNNGTPTTQGSPFTKLQGTVIEYGTSSPKAIVKAGGTVIFLANTNKGEFAGVAVLEGYSTKLISPPSINYRIELCDIESAIAYAYADEGHLFYMLTFPNNDLTLCYDLTTQMWHERSTSKLSDNLTHRHLSNQYVYFAGKHLVSDYRLPRILEMSSAYYTDLDVPIVGVRTAPHIFDKTDLNSIFIKRFILDMESGVGDGTSQPVDLYFAWYANGDHIADGSGFAGNFDPILTHNGDPMCWLSWSNDSGHTWSNEYTASIGRQGEYKKRVAWRINGRARDRVYKVRFADATKRVLLGAYING